MVTGFLGASKATLLELNGGCVCCSVQENLLEAFERITAAPDRSWGSDAGYCRMVLIGKDLDEAKLEVGLTVFVTHSPAVEAQPSLSCAGFVSAAELSAAAALFFAAATGLLDAAFSRLAIACAGLVTHDVSRLDSIRSASSLSRVATYALLRE
jgi:hypothetical protein